MLYYSPAMEPRIQYAKTKDGVSIAYWTMGTGPAVVYVNTPPWSNIEFEAREWPMHGILASRCTLIRYDHRGTGLSHREVDEFSLDAHVQDLEAVVDRLALDQFILLGFDGPIAIAYAANHPERVSHLLLYGAVARAADFYDLPRIRNAHAVLDSGDWEMFTDTLGLAWAGWPDSGLARDLGRFFRTCTEPEQARKMVDAYRQVDVTDLLPSLSMPVSIVYPRASPVSDIGIARTLAASIPHARLTIADSTTGWSPETQKALFAVLDEALAEVTGASPAIQPAPGGFATILFTDMESSTALTQRLGDAQAQEVVRAHNTIVREALRAQRGGSEIKHTGDGIMASFTTASSALGCAVAIQQAVAAHIEEHPDAPLAVRIGLNAGEPVAEEGDLFGTAVQLARRICDHAQPGEILASNVVRELAAGKNFLFADQGDVIPKGFEEPVRLYEVRWRES